MSSHSQVECDASNDRYFSVYCAQETAPWIIPNSRTVLTSRHIFSHPIQSNANMKHTTDWERFRQIDSENDCRVIATFVQQGNFIRCSKVTDSAVFFFTLLFQVHSVHRYRLLFFIAISNDQLIFELAIIILLFGRTFCHFSAWMM